MPGHWGDVDLWGAWSTYNMKHGLWNAYGSGTDYTPLYQYVLWLFGKIQGSEESIRHYIGFIRVFTLLAEFLGLYLVYRWMDRKWDYVVLLLISMFNLAYSYNTIIWCQCDAILASAVFAAFYCLYRGKMVLSGLMLILMVNMKLQGIVLVPLWGLLAIEYIARTRRWRDIPYTLLAIVALQVLILAPFAFGGGGLAQIWKKVYGLVGAAPYISMNAFNLWYLVVPDLPGKQDDAVAIGRFTYNQIGLILFCVGSFLAFLPLLFVTIRQVFRKKQHEPAPAPSRVLIWLTAALLVMLFFFFNTQMHERYSHPAFIFITAYAFYTRRFGLYTLFSIAYFLNLEKVLRWFALKNYETAIFDARFVATLFAICIVWTGVLLYRTARHETREEHTGALAGGS